VTTNDSLSLGTQFNYPLAKGMEIELHMSCLALNTIAMQPVSIGVIVRTYSLWFVRNRLKRLDCESRHNYLLLRMLELKAR
jgi:hypothetical protein